MTAILFSHLSGRECCHIILTIRQQRALRPMIRRLLQAFGKLRESPVWKRQCIGGSRFLHVTNDGGVRGYWGPHLHLILETEQIDLIWLRRRWLALTGDGEQVDWRIIPDNRRDHMIISRYVTRSPFESFKDDWRAIGAYREALGKTAPARTFGSWHRMSLLPRRKPAKI